MKRVVITGGTGFVGANLTRRLLRDGHEIHLFVRPQHQAWRIAGIANAIRLHVLELQDEVKVAAAIASIQPEWIFHLAAHGAYSWQTDVSEIMRTNIFGTVNLVEACVRQGFESFVNTGSSSEYGLKDHAPHECEWIDPNSAYAVAKASATQYCRYTAINRSQRISTLRLYSVYGPYEEPQRLIPSLLTQGMQGKLPPLVNSNIARDYVYVDDVCEAYIRAATSSNLEAGAVYNVGTGIQTSLAEIVDTVRQMLNITVEPQWGTMPQRQWDTNTWVADNSKLTRELGWRAEHSLEAGLKQTVEHLTSLI